MAHGFLSVSGGGGRSFGLPFDWLRKKVSDALKNLQDKNKQVSGELDKVSKDLRTDVEEVKVGIEKDPVVKKMLSPGKYGGIQRYSGGELDNTQKTPQLPPASPRLKGGTFTDISKPPGGLNPDTFFKQAQTGVGPSGEYLTNAQRREAFVKSRQEAIQTAAAVNKSPSITPDSGVEIVAAVNRNTEAIIRLVDITKQQTANDTKLSEKAALTQEKLMGRQRAALEERSLERGGDLSGFMTPEMKKIQKQATSGAGPGGQGYSGQLGGGGPNVMDMLDIGSDIMDMRKGKVRRITQGRDGRTSRQRLRDMKARKAGLRPSSRGVRPSGGGLARTGGSALGRGAGLGKALAGGAKGGGLLKGAAMAGKATRGIPGLGLLTAGLEFGDRMSSGQNALQAGVGTAGSVGGGLAGAAAGAAIGSVIPGIGTAIGAVIGGLLGSMGGGAVADMATGANNVRPMAVGGIITSPLNALMGEAGKEAVFPLEGKEGEKVFKMFGMGILEAQLGAPAMVAKIGALGLKKYFEKDGGFERMGEGLKDFFSGLGGALASLFGGNANAGTLDQAADYLNVGGGTGEQNLAAFLSTMEASGNQNQADAFQVMLNRAADAQAGGSMKAYGTTLGDQITAREQFSPISSAIYGVSADSAAAAKYGPISRALGSNPAERKKKLLQIASQPDGLVALQKLFGGGSASDAAKVLQDFKSGGALSQRSASDIGSMVSFRGYRSGAGDFNRGAGGNFFFGQGSKGKVGSLSQVSPGGSLGGGGNASIAAAAQSLKGMDTSGGPGGGSVSCVYAVNKVFDRAGVKPPWGGAQSTDAVINASKSAGWQQVGFEDARPGDIWVYDANDGRTGHVGIMMPNGRVLSNSSSQAKFIWEADKAELLDRYPKNGMTPPGGTFFRAPGSGNIASPPGTGATPSAATAPSGQYNIPGAPELSNALRAANPNTGTPMMATSAQVAMAGITQSGAAPTIINNNYYTTGGGGAVNGNGLPTGIDMTSTGADVFSILKPRTIG